MQVHRHMDVICVRTQIFLIIILNVQRWIICAYKQVSHRDTDVFANNPALEDFVIQNRYLEFLRTYAKNFHVSIKDLRICAKIQCWKTLLSEIIIRNFCACTQKFSTSLLRMCVYAQKIQCWKTLLSEIVNRNFCACTQKSSTSLLRICVYAQKIQQMIIIKSSNNPTVDVLRPAQKLQVWNIYIIIIVT